MAFDKSEYDKQRVSQAYDRLSINVPSGKGRVLQEALDKRGITLSEAVVTAIKQQYDIDLAATSTSKKYESINEEMAQMNLFVPKKFRASLQLFAKNKRTTMSKLIQEACASYYPELKNYE